MVKSEEKPAMVFKTSRMLALGLAGAVLAACGGGSNGGALKAYVLAYFTGDTPAQ
jgi:hypothetical protein